jgi:hypothetical protein
MTIKSCTILKFRWLDTPDKLPAEARTDLEKIMQTAAHCTDNRSSKARTRAGKTVLTDRSEGKTSGNGPGAGGAGPDGEDRRGRSDEGRGGRGEPSRRR